MPARKRRPRGYIEELPSIRQLLCCRLRRVDSLIGKPQYLRETARRYAE